MRGRRALGLLVLTGLAGPLQGQTWVSQLPGTPLTARTAGLGGASAAMIGYAGSVFTNPAGLAPIHVTSVEATYGKPEPKTHYLMGAVAARVGALNIGGGFRYLQFEPGAAQHNNLEAVTSLVTRVRGVALGASGHYYSIEDSSGAVRRVLSTDAAATVAFFEIAALAFSVQNIGRIRSGGPVLEVPSIFRLGFSLNLIDSYSNGRLLATIERVWVDGDGLNRVGLEGGAVFYGLGLVARIGVGSQLPGSPLSNPSFGGTIILGRGAGIDYAYLDRRGLRPLHLVGLRFTL